MCEAESIAGNQNTKEKSLFLHQGREALGDKLLKSSEQAYKVALNPYNSPLKGILPTYNFMIHILNCSQKHCLCFFLVFL